MPGVITAKPTKGTGILKFSDEVWLKFEYDLESDDPEAIAGYFHVGEATIYLLPAIE